MNTKQIFPLFLLALIGTTTMSHAASDAMQGTSTETITTDTKEGSTVTPEGGGLPSGMVKVKGAPFREYIAFLYDLGMVGLVFTSSMITALFPAPIYFGLGALVFKDIGTFMNSTALLVCVGFSLIIFVVSFILGVIRLHKMGWIGNRAFGIRAVGADGKDIGYLKTFVRGLIKFVTRDGLVEYMLGVRPLHERVFNTYVVERYEEGVRS